MNLRADMLIAASIASLTMLGACTEGPSPVDPGGLEPLMHHRPGHSGGGNDGGGDEGGQESQTPRITLAGAMSADYEADVSENRHRISISTGSDGPAVDLWFAGARQAYAEGRCTWLNEPDAAAADLIADQYLAGADMGGISIEIDKRALGEASDGHHIGYTFHSPELGTSVRVALFAHGDPPPTVHLVGEEDGVRTFVFSAGVARSWRVTSPPRQAARLFCGDHGDEVTVTIADG